MSSQIVMVLPPEAASVSVARHTLAEALTNADVTPDCVYDAQVALSEACTNVFHHVTAGENFEVLMNIGDVELTLHVLDSGPGFPINGHQADWPEVYAENGRGMALMTALTDDANFDFQNGGGSVRLKKRLFRNADTAVLPLMPSAG
jgi:serine/threonine-protein kinase RsbW